MTGATRSRLILLLVLSVLLALGLTACKKAPPPVAPLPPVAVAPKDTAPAEAPGDQEEKTRSFAYVPSDYRNPFGSLLRVKKVTEDGVPEEELSPLQRVPVNDMTVQSIILSRRRSVAHIITPDGKAHIVTVGTPVGRHKGKIVKIRSDEIVVEEEFEDYLGRAFKQETVLRLREKEGES